MTELLVMHGAEDGDIFAIRQRGREVAEALGFDQQDQTRVATALSEVGRDVLGAGPVTVTFEVADAPSRLVATVTTGHLPPERRPSEVVGIAAARRLLDEVSVAPSGRGWSITLGKRLPPGTPIGAVALAGVRAALRRGRVGSPAEELRAQNVELVSALEEVTRRQADLVRLNDELEETNRGVMAMYGELSQELEDTNRGVVALYAELDEKGRQLVAANEAKSRFLRNVSHELRAPISSILGLVDLLRTEPLSVDQHVQVDHLRGSARSLLGMVNELLDLARAEAGRVEIRPEPADLGALFAELRGTLRPLAEERSVDLVVEPPGVTRFRTDPELLARVLRNLVVNAVKFTPPGGSVRLEAHAAPGPQLELVVSDDGVGIAPEHQEAVFEEFFQVPGPMQTTSGTGLGLPYARRVAEALGGELTLVSAPGAGSTFTVRLRAVADADAGAGLDRGPVGRVLVVDDDEGVVEVVRAMLDGIATEVEVAGGGEEALRLIRQARPDVVLLDLRMPGLDGAGVMAELWADPDLRAVPVVLMTNVDIDGSVRQAAEPAAGLLAKSQLRPATLAAALHAAIEGKTGAGGLR